MDKAEGRNQTPIVELILLGFGNSPELLPLLFLLFLVIYIAAVAGNLLIIVLVRADPHLHTPMYYFVANLSAVEICYISTTLPRLLASLATGVRTISLQNCFVQFDVYGILSTAECLLLTAMCYDRYLAICHPLRYTALMNGRVCGHMVAGCWIYGIFYTIMLQIIILQLVYCGPKEIDHFFCDFSIVKKPFCGKIQTLQWLAYFLALIVTVGVFLFTLAAYVCIITNILRIPSNIGRKKSFSTCSSHLIVVTFYYGSIMTFFVVPMLNPPTILLKIMSV
uniref:Olfactory receptor n=1 Tax=Pelodiscus sinensis TaxID=13735 RepID=K7EY13_PELSI